MSLVWLRSQIWGTLFTPTFPLQVLLIGTTQVLLKGTSCPFIHNLGPLVNRELGGALFSYLLLMIKIWNFHMPKHINFSESCPSKARR